jgi:hypothetical protein
MTGCVYPGTPGIIVSRKWGLWRDLQRHHTQHRVCSRMVENKRTERPFSLFIQTFKRIY